MEQSRQLPLGFGNSKVISVGKYPKGKVVYVQAMRMIRWRKTLRIIMVCSVFFCCAERRKRVVLKKRKRNEQRAKKEEG